MEKKDEGNTPTKEADIEKKETEETISKSDHTEKEKETRAETYVGIDVPEKAVTNEEEATCTLNDIIDGMNSMEEMADLLFATQDPSVCTYPEGYKPRQTVFACLSCTPAPQMAGICYGCSLNCHSDHDIVELYTKRKFKCDCGNSKFGDKKCTLYEEKDKTNEYNVYNHNYHGKFCTCEVYYPDDDQTRELAQCEICEDWFHHEHMPSKSIIYDTEQSADADNASHICTICITKLPFLRHISPGKDILCHSKLTAEQTTIDDSSKVEALMINNFRQKLCKCTDCVRVYELADCEFLLDTEDDMATFENESKAKVAEEGKPTEAEEMRELVKEVGMDGAQMFYAGINEFKRKFAEFMVNREDGKTISVEDVKQFTENLKNEREAKRSRFE